MEDYRDKLVVDRTVFLRDGSKCYAVAEFNDNILMRAIYSPSIYFKLSYKNDLTHSKNRNKDVMKIINNGKVEWERLAEEV